MSKSHLIPVTQPGEANPLPIRWGASNPKERGPIIGTLSNLRHRNVLGAHGGPHAVYRALAVATGQLDSTKRSDLTNTEPTAGIGPYPQWFNAGMIVSMDPWGAEVSRDFGELIRQGYDIRPTIAVTKGHIDLLDMSAHISAAMAEGRLKPDGEILLESGDCVVTKAAIDAVWHLPGVARRFGITEEHLRRTLFQQTGGMFSDIESRQDLEVFLPPIDGQWVYIFGDPRKLADPNVPLTARVHDACNGSDVLASDICTCRPYLMVGIEECVRAAQQGGVGLIVYFLKEGRALGGVTKLLVYNRRKRQPGGDTAASYFECTEAVAGVRDARFQQLMPDVLHWLGVRKIHRLVSMSNDKHDSIVRSGIEVAERFEIPEGRVPRDAWVEIEAKKAAGYFTTGPVSDPSKVKGRVF